MFFHHPLATPPAAKRPDVGATAVRSVRIAAMRLVLGLGTAIAAGIFLLAGHSASTLQAGSRPAFQQQPSGGTARDLEVLEIRPNFFVIAGAGSHVGVQIGEDGVVVVDAGSAARAEAVAAAIKKLTPRLIRYVIDTSADPDHIGGNEVLSKAGQTLF